MSFPACTKTKPADKKSLAKVPPDFVRDCAWAFLLATAFMVGCSPKPHDTTLPSSGRLTPAEAEAVVGKLIDIERPIFRRWVERMNKGEQFGGEPTATTVRQALINQQAYETQQSEFLARAQAAAEEQQARESAEKRRIEGIYAHRQAVHNQVRKYIDATIPIYRPQTFYDQYNRPVSGLIEFHLKLTNRAHAAAIGIAGLVTIQDVFGRDLGSYPFALEPRIGPNQTIIYVATLNFDPRNEQHQALWRAKNIVSSWFFESAAFADGTRIDSDSVARGTESISPVKATGKGSNT